MKKSQLKQIIKEEIQKEIKVNQPKLPELNLKLGNYYKILDPGIDEWNDEYEYLGFDTNSREYMFKAFDSPTDNFYFIGVSQTELAKHVRPSNFK